jgi:TolB-like protein
VTTPILFGPFSLDLEARELRSGTRCVRLQDQPFEILRLMLERPGHVVTRDQLRERLWPAGTFVDFEHSLNAAVKRLRAALGDDADDPRFIDTVPRRGYRFIGTVGGPEPAERSHHVRVALLPFLDLGGDREQDYFGEGLTEEMGAHLGRLCGDRVGIISTRSTARFERSDLGARAIGEALRADYLLEGSVRCEGERVRITARLVRTANETQLWAEIYERPLIDSLGVQAEVAARIARSLAMELAPGSAPAPTTGSPAAYQAFLKGCYYWRKTADSGATRAVIYFEQALAADPSFAAAYAGMAKVQVLRAEYYHECPRAALEKAQAHVARAMPLDPALADAHLAHAEVSRLLQGDVVTARASFMRAIAINPSYESARIGLAKMLAADRAQELDPMCLTANVTAAWVRYLAGDYETAASLCRDTLEMDDQFLNAIRVLGGALLEAGRRNEALRTLERAVDAGGGDPVSLAWLAYARATAASPVVATSLLGRMADVSRSRYCSPYYLAVVHAAVGDTAEACRALRAACEDADPMLPNLHVDPRLAALRADAAALSTIRTSVPRAALA